MLYAYIVISAALVPILNNFFDILGHSYSWWLVPLMVIGFVLVFIILHALVFIIWVLSIDVNKPQKERKCFRKMLNITIPLLLKLARVKVNASGTDIVPENGRMLFVSNHQHDFDPLIILSVFPQYGLGFIGKKDIYATMPFVAKVMHGIYGLPIDRENNRAAAKTIIEASRLLKEDKASIGLFPEGYVSTSCELLPLRNGSLKIAFRAGVPIVVCVINNTREIPKRMFLKKTEIEFRVLSVITPEEFKGKTTTEIGDIIHSQIETALKEIRG